MRRWSSIAVKGAEGEDGDNITNGYCINRNVRFRDTHADSIITCKHNGTVILVPSPKGGLWKCIPRLRFGRHYTDDRRGGNNPADLSPQLLLSAV